MTLRKAILGALLLTPAISLAADDLNYSFIEANYIIQDVDLFEDDDLFDNFVDDFDDGDGFGVRGQLEFGDLLFGYAGFSDTESDFTFIDDNGLLIPQGQDIKTLNLGLGFHMPLAEKVDLVGRVGYIDVDFGDFELGAQDNSGIDDTDDLEDFFNDLNEDDTDGFSADIGVRAQMVEWLEGTAGIRYIDLDTTDDFSFFGSLLFEFTENIGLNVGVDAGDDLQTYTAGIRYSF